MAEGLTEERLAEMERRCGRLGLARLAEAESYVHRLVAEVRRLKKLLDGERHKPGAFDRMTDWAQQMEHERDEARSLLKQAINLVALDLDPEEFRPRCRGLFAKWAIEEQEQRRVR